MTPPTAEALAEGIRQLSIVDAWERFQAALRAADTEELAAEAQAAFRADVRAAWKRAARQLHPDAGGSHEAFVATADVVAWLLRLRVRPRRRHRPFLGKKRAVAVVLVRKRSRE